MSTDQGDKEERPDGSTSRCPVCGGPAKPDQSAFPFCSPRCRHLDLARWFGEDYRVGRPADEDDLD